MGRTSYTDDYGDDFPGQINLFRANVRRSMRSKAGQERLRELLAALRALPVKELHPEIFVEGRREEPRVCALGAWALKRAAGDTEAAAAMVNADPDYGWDVDAADRLAKDGWPRLVVMETVYQNDEEFGVREVVQGPANRYQCWPLVQFREETPAERICANRDVGGVAHRRYSEGRWERG